jgi:hypothetical protein
LKNVRKIFLCVFLTALLPVTFEVGRANHRDTVFEASRVLKNKSKVVAQLGSPFNIYNCKTDISESSFMYSDNMCKRDKRVLEVYAFEHCRICEFFDPGWFLIGLDAEEKIVDKYNIRSP